MSDAPKRIWAFHAGPMVGLYVGKSPGVGPNVTEYTRTDISAAREAKLQAEIDRLRAALAPFANAADNWPDEWPDTADNIDAVSLDLTAGDFRRARAALATFKEQAND